LGSTPTRFRHNLIFFQRLGGFAGQQKAAIRDFGPVLVLIQPAARTVTGFLNLDVQSRKRHQRGNSTRAFDLCLLIISVAIFISTGRWKRKTAWNRCRACG